MKYYNCGMSDALLRDRRGRERLRQPLQHKFRWEA